MTILIWFYGLSKKGNFYHFLKSGNVHSILCLVSVVYLHLEDTLPCGHSLPSSGGYSPLLILYIPSSGGYSPLWACSTFIWGKLSPVNSPHTFIWGILSLVNMLYLHLGDTLPWWHSLPSSGGCFPLWTCSTFILGILFRDGILYLHLGDAFPCKHALVDNARASQQQDVTGNQIVFTRPTCKISHYYIHTQHRCLHV